MQIKILEVGPIETRRGPKKTYKVFKLSYSVDQQSRDKDIMEFSPAFAVLKAAQPGEYYEIETKKNDAGYIDWLSAKSTGAPTTAAASGGKGATASRGTWETPEERAARQIMIVRQSSIASAVNLLPEDIPPERVIEVAKKFETYVLYDDDFDGDVAEEGEADVE